MDQLQKIIQISLTMFFMLAMPVNGRSQAKPVIDTTRAAPKPVISKPLSNARPYNDVITAKAITDDGLFKIHKVDERYFFEIPDSLLGRDILIVNRISKAAAGGRVQTLGYSGDQIGENVIRFEKAPNNKVFMKSISFQEMSGDSTENGMYRSVVNSNVQPLIASFDIKTFSSDDKGVVIDFTDFISGDNDILFFENNIKRALFLAQLLSDRSYIATVRSHPMNIEIRTIKTYLRSAPGMPGASAGTVAPATYELNSSMVLLPKDPMKPRYADARVGYLAASYTDFDKDPQGVKKVSWITRWRLEPKEEDYERYFRGELVEPKKPIVFYIDPATPKKWVPYLIKGVQDWQKAFEQAGFKHAIIAKEAPNDPEWSMEDARHSVIVYKASDIPNASGPHVHDPRSGEILETHVNWYHNVMQLIHHWYFIQASAVDPKARKMQFDDELMGQLIRFVSSHEIGHTLGLLHNFGASSATAVEKLRDKKWVEANGHTSSIMDYARFNYVAQPEDSINETGLFPRIGDYDKWAIEWGYKWLPQYQTPDAESSYLNTWIIEKSKDRRLWFGSEKSTDDPRSQSEDIGDNAMKAGEYGIKNLKRIVPNLIEWTKVKDEGYSNLSEIYVQLQNQFYRYLSHASKNIGGRYETPKAVEQSGPVYEIVPGIVQKAAVGFLDKQLFTTPSWLLDKKILSLTGTSPFTIVSNMQNAMLGDLLGGTLLNKMLIAEALNPDAYRINSYIQDLQKVIWSELMTKKPISIYRRNLQKIYVEKMIILVKPTVNALSPQQPVITDVGAVAKMRLSKLKEKIRLVLPGIKDEMSVIHLQYIIDRISNAFDEK